jgi:septum formation protein
MKPLWLASDPLLLASRSAVRRALLQSAGIPVRVEPASIDERAIEAQAGTQDPGETASLLARTKALAVAAKHPKYLVLGADQTLALGDRRFSKAADRAAARAHLLALRGRTHTLHSAIAMARDADVVFEHHAQARLTMRNFSDAFLDRYIDAAGDAVTASVGGYQLEGLGIQLFDRIEGDHSTVLGLPIMPLLQWLRAQGLLAS